MSEVRTPAQDQEAAPDTPKALGTRWLRRGLVIRVIAYMVGGHLFAAFLFLLFEVGKHAH